MDKYNAPRSGGIQGVDNVETEAIAWGAVGMKVVAAGGAEGH